MGRRVPRPGLRLRPAAGELPVGFDLGEHLAGRDREAKPPLESRGRPVAGRALSQALGGLGLGPVTVTMRGWERPRGGRVDRLRPFTVRARVVGGLDAYGLGRLLHRLSRRVATRRGPRRTPEEILVGEILLTTDRSPAPPAPPIPDNPRGPKPPPLPVAPAARTPPPAAPRRPYDTETGRWVSWATYRRSRAAIRAAQRRQGERGYRPGRYRLR